MARVLFHGVFRSISFTRCHEDRAHEEGHLDAILDLINETADQTDETRNKLLSDMINGIVPQTIHHNDPDQLRIEKQKAIVGYFTNVGCALVNQDPNSSGCKWKVPKKSTFCVRVKVAHKRTSKFHRKGKENDKNYSAGYMQYYPRGIEKRMWKNRLDGTELPRPCKYAGLNLATILLHIRRELRQYWEENGGNMQLPRAVNQMMLATKAGDESQQTICRHLCQEKECLKMQCLQWGSKSENAKDWKKLEKEGKEALAARLRGRQLEEMLGTPPQA